MNKRLVAVVVGCVGAAGAAFAQSAQGTIIIQQATRPAPAAQPAQVEPQTVVGRTGTLVLNLTISIVSAIPTTTPIKCIFSPTVYGFDLATGAQDQIFESAQVIATRSGATATCTVQVPYSWRLSFLAQDRLSPNFQVVATDADGNGRVTGLPGVFLQASPEAIAIPRQNATTTFTRTAKI